MNTLLSSNAQKDPANMTTEQMDRLEQEARVRKLQRDEQGLIGSATEFISGHVSTGLVNVGGAAITAGCKAREYPLITTLVTVAVGVVIVKTAMDYMQNNQMPVISN